MPQALLQIICADLTANHEARGRLNRTLVMDVEEYARSRDVNQLIKLAVNLEEMRKLHQVAADLLFAADAAITERIAVVNANDGA